MSGPSQWVGGLEREVMLLGGFLGRCACVALLKAEQENCNEG